MDRKKNGFCVLVPDTNHKTFIKCAITVHLRLSVLTHFLSGNSILLYEL